MANELTNKNIAIVKMEEKLKTLENEAKSKGFTSTASNIDVKEVLKNTFAEAKNVRTNKESLNTLTTAIQDSFSGTEPYINGVFPKHKYVSTTKNIQTAERIIKSFYDYTDSLTSLVKSETFVGCKGCGNGCAGTCRDLCYDTCNDKCSSTCKDKCSSTCNDRCKDGCANGCSTACADCTTTCSGTCKDSSCTNQCTGGCNTKCTECTGTCQNACKASCQKAGSCESSCNNCTGCNTNCNNTCNTSCSSCNGTCSSCTGGCSGCNGCSGGCYTRCNGTKK